jgi:hypothetical protein
MTGFMCDSPIHVMGLGHDNLVSPWSVFRVVTQSSSCLKPSEIVGIRYHDGIGRHSIIPMAIRVVAVWVLVCVVWHPTL